MPILSKLAVILALCLVPAAYAGENSAPVLHGIPGPVEWKNAPLDWAVDGTGALSITADKQTDWFISPLDGGKTENTETAFQAGR